LGLRRWISTGSANPKASNTQRLAALRLGIGWRKTDSQRFPADLPREGAARGAHRWTSGGRWYSTNTPSAAVPDGLADWKEPFRGDLGRRFGNETATPSLLREDLLARVRDRYDFLRTKRSELKPDQGGLPPTKKRMGHQGQVNRPVAIASCGFRRQAALGKPWVVAAATTSTTNRKADGRAAQAQAFISALSVRRHGQGSGTPGNAFLNREGQRGLFQEAAFIGHGAGGAPATPNLGHRPTPIKVLVHLRRLTRPISREAMIETAGKLAQRDCARRWHVMRQPRTPSWEKPHLGWPRHIYKTARGGPDLGDDSRKRPGPSPNSSGVIPRRNSRISSAQFAGSPPLPPFSAYGAHLSGSKFTKGRVLRRGKLLTRVFEGGACTSPAAGPGSRYFDALTNSAGTGNQKAP